MEGCIGYFFVVIVLDDVCDVIFEIQGNVVGCYGMFFFYLCIQMQMCGGFQVFGVMGIRCDRC